jgi:DNA-binding FadR family transcriptional regulator
MAQSNAQQVYRSVFEVMQQRIVDGEWQPGQRIPSITQLAHDLGVSTGPVREAARVLASRGVLRIEHGRGMFVTDAPGVAADLYHAFKHVGTGSVLELWEARRVLEPELAALAAERGTDAEQQEIYQIALAMEQAATHGQDFVEPDIQFHQRIAAAAKNSVLAGMMTGLNSQILEGRKITVTLPGMTARAVRYHLLIAEAIRDRSALQARLLMLAYVNDAIDALLKLEQAMRGEQVPSSRQDGPIFLSREAVRGIARRADEAPQPFT